MRRQMVTTMYNNSAYYLPLQGYIPERRESFTSRSAEVINRN